MDTKATKRRRGKPRALRMDTALKIRFTDEQRQEIEDAARREETGVSSWIRRVALREARRPEGDEEAHSG